MLRQGKAPHLVDRSLAVLSLSGVKGPEPFWGQYSLFIPTLTPLSLCVNSAEQDVRWL
jgi:hypothetical protein